MHTKRKQAFMTYLPLIALFSAFFVVFYQSGRKERLKQELADTDREYARSEKRYQELRLQELKAANTRKPGTTISISQ